MRKMLKITLLFVVLVNTVMLTGCWSYREIDKLAIATGFAIDKSTTEDGYTITVEVINFSSGGKETKIGASLLEASGETIFDAVRNLTQICGKKIYWAHTSIVIISRDIAGEGISKVIDIIYRDAEIRPTMYLLISMGKTAKEILNQQGALTDIASFEIENMVKAQENAGVSPKTPVFMYIGNISGDNASSVVPAISLIQMGEKRTAELSGTALVKNDKFIGFINARETKYLLLVLNQFKQGMLVLHIERDGRQDKITLEVFDNEVTIKPVLENGSLKFILDIKIDAAISELQTQEDYISEGKYKQLEKDASAELLKNIAEVIKKIQGDYGADVFGFSRYVRTDLPDYWRSVKNDWDRAFQNSNIEIKVSVKIRNSALAQKPIKVGE